MAKWSMFESNTETQERSTTVQYTSTEVKAHWVECKNPAMCHLPYRTRDGVRSHRVYAHTLLTPIS